MMISILLSKYEMRRTTVLSKYDAVSLYFAAPSSPSMVLTAQCVSHGMWQIAMLRSECVLTASVATPVV